MSLLIKTLKPGQILHIQKALSVTQIRKAHWYTDYIPGSYPKTKEERKSAAAHYNLLPEEYECYPNDETSSGDYPKLPLRSVDSKDPWYPYDNPELKRNFNEPVHIRIVHLFPEMLSTNVKNKYKDALTFIVLFSSVLLFMYSSTKIIHVFPAAEKQFVNPDVVHYTFELDKGKSKE